MIDSHTHILPGVDDGAADLAESLAMLRMEADQGVDRVALTPHFYRERETAEAFLARRDRAWDRLQAAIAALPQGQREALPQLTLGAEVAWVPGLAECACLDRLCYAGSEYLLVELPHAPWSKSLCAQLRSFLGATGMTPVIAHMDRYRTMQKKEQIRDLLELEIPIQLSAAALLRPLGRRWALDLLDQAAEILLISDCHSPVRRPPNLGPALVWLEKHRRFDLLERLEEGGEALSAAKELP